MIKLVKFNLLLDGKRCRTIEDVRENFNLVDILEQLESGKLEKWLKVRKYDKLPNLIDTLTLFEKAKELCEFFNIKIDSNDIKTELIIYEYTKLSEEQKNSDNIIKTIFQKYKGDILNLQPIIITMKIKLSDLEIKTMHNIEILKESICIIPIYIKSNFGTHKDSNYILYDKKENIIQLEHNENNFFNETKVFSGLKLKFKSYAFYKSYSNTITLTFLDLYNKVDTSIKPKNITYYEHKILSEESNILNQSLSSKGILEQGLESLNSNIKD